MSIKAVISLIQGGAAIAPLVKKYGASVVKEARKHIKDLTTKRTSGQKQIRKATQGQRATREKRRQGQLEGAVVTSGIGTPSFSSGKPSSKKDKFLDRVVKKTERKPRKTNAKLGKPSDIAKRLPTSHTIKKGDTLTSIAREKGTTVAKLKELNKVDPKKLRIGSKVKLR
jgi:LysM repeat protein|tara:strand:- start:355 stop:864 length:510 start_codon:yes stop_codon:yes gene_type:complete